MNNPTPIEIRVVHDYKEINYVLPNDMTLAEMGDVFRAILIFLTYSPQQVDELIPNMED